MEAGWGPEPVWTGTENLAPTRTRSPDRPARSDSLHRLSYPCPICRTESFSYIVDSHKPRQSIKLNGVLTTEVMMCRMERAGGFESRSRWEMAEKSHGLFQGITLAGRHQQHTQIVFTGRQTFTLKCGTVGEISGFRAVQHRSSLFWHIMRRGLTLGW